MEAKSNNESGLRGCLRRNRTGSRCSDKEREETGLDYFGARYFSGALGRFTSPDIALLSRVDSPQMWNLYAYTANNTLTRVDLDGRNWFEIEGVWTWYDGADVDKDCNGL